MPSTKVYSLVNLPEGLRGQFEKVEKRLWRVETTTALCRIAASLIFSLLLVFISDRLWDTSAAARSAIFLCGLAGAFIGVAVWARHWIWHRRDMRALATLVQGKYRRLGDRLLGIVELANEENHPVNFSPELYHAAIEQVAQESEKFDFQQSISTRQAGRLSWLAAAAVLVLLGVCVVLPQAGANAFQRWINPMAAIPRFTLVALRGFPSQLIVPHGEAFDIAGTVNYSSFWKPLRVFGRLGADTKVDSQVQAGTIHLRVPAQVEKGVLEVRVGDAMARVQIIPTHRPSLQDLTAQIHLPDYLKYPDQTESVQNGTLRAVEGSTVGLHGTVSRPLKWALMSGESNYPATLDIQGQGFSSQPATLPVAGVLVFSWRDQLGLTNAEPWRLTLQRDPDAPPVPSIPELPRNTTLLAGDVLHIRAQAQDDFGVRDLGLSWSAVSDAGEVPLTTTEMKYEMDTTQQTSPEKVFLWSPALYQIPMDSTVELQAFAVDFFPGRTRARTPAFTIRVLSPAEHAELIRQEMEALMAQLEDVSRLQDKIVSDLKNVQDAGKEMTNAAQNAQLNQSKDDQLNNARQLDDLAKQGESTIREAMKNQLIPADTIEQMSKTLQQWQQLSQDKMPEAARSMASAQNSNSQPQPGSPSSPQSQQPASPQQQKSLDDAQKQAEAIKEALAQNQQKGNDDLDQLQAVTLADRLRKVGGEEKGLSSQITTNLAGTIGLLARDLPPKLQELNASFVHQQTSARDQTVALQGEISRFFERTQKTNYGKVSQDMKDTQATNALDRISGLIHDNIIVATAGDLTNWSARFDSWADDLQPKSGGGGGQSGQGGKPPADLTKQLIALLRLRERESTVRDQTTVLETGKAATPNYNDQASLLSDSQEILTRTLDGIHSSLDTSQLDEPFEQTGGDMKTAGGLLAKPQTDAPTDLAEGKSIDGLSDLINLINELSQKNSRQQPQPGSSAATTAEQMAFLTSLMQRPGNARPMTAPSPGGGNLFGGTTDKPGNNNTGGNVSGPGAGSRDVHKSAAGAIHDAPQEFRDALENYFRAVENQKN